MPVAPGVVTNLVAQWSADTVTILTWVNHYQPNSPADRIRIEESVNDGPWIGIADLSGFGDTVPSQASVANQPNRMTRYRVIASNVFGTAAASTPSMPLFTSPAMPTGLRAVRTSPTTVALDWVNNVGFDQFVTQVWRGTVVGGVISWDASPLTGTGPGVEAWDDTSAPSTVSHVYRLRTWAALGADRMSPFTQHVSVMAAAPPNPPTPTPLPNFVPLPGPITVSWTHNPTDASEQTRAQVWTSNDAGDTWSLAAAIYSPEQSWQLPYQGSPQMQIRYRTWGVHSNPSDWSQIQMVTWRTRPVVTITEPGPVVRASHTSVSFGFSQAEGATLTSATIELLNAEGVVIETRHTTALVGTQLNTRLTNGATYTVRVVARDSHGIESLASEHTFTVDLVEPQPAVATGVYLPDIAASLLTVSVVPGSDGLPPQSLSVLRYIGDSVETVIDRMPFTGGSTQILDPLPTTNGDNRYEVITFSAEGAGAPPAVVIVAARDSKNTWWNTGDGWTEQVHFFGNPLLGSAPTRESVLFAAAGRKRPVALFGEVASHDVSGTATVVAGRASTVEEIESFLLEAALICYRDPSGRRLFGRVRGSFANRNAHTARLQYQVSEAT